MEYKSFLMQGLRAMGVVSVLFAACSADQSQGLLPETQHHQTTASNSSTLPDEVEMLAVFQESAGTLYENVEDPFSSDFGSAVIRKHLYKHPDGVFSEIYVFESAETMISTGSGNLYWTGASAGCAQNGSDCLSGPGGDVYVPYIVKDRVFTFPAE